VSLSRFQLTALSIEQCPVRSTDGDAWKTVFDTLAHFENQCLPIVQCRTSGQYILPALRELYIHELDPQCAAVLEHLHAPRATFTRAVVTFEPSRSTEETRDLLCRALSRHLARRLQTLPVLHYSMNHAVQYMEKSGESERAVLELEFTDTLSSEWCLLEALGDAGCLSSVHTLRIIMGFLLPYVQVRPDAVFAAFSAVRRLEVDQASFMQLITPKSKSPLALHFPVLESLALLNTCMRSLASLGRNVRQLSHEIRARVLPMHTLRFVESMPAHEALIEQLGDVVNEVLWEVHEPSGPAVDEARYRGEVEDRDDSYEETDNGD
jgi:hypothetical protein